jgi:hypothetical protein
LPRCAIFDVAKHIAEEDGIDRALREARVVGSGNDL